MQLRTINHVYKRLCELGLRNSAIIIIHKGRQKLFSARWRSRALTHKAQHSWPLIAQKHGLKESFSSYWDKLILKSLPAIDCTEDLIAQANDYTLKRFTLLGSPECTFTTIPWHTDFRLQHQSSQADCSFDAHSLYKDIKIDLSASHDIIKDIKVPWELSRFHHAPILGIAYEKINNDIYTQTFITHITDWLDHNPYLIGIHWLCPMEVAIRAINWIWAWHFFKKSPSIPSEFWEQFTCSLYDHMHYLENNWEIFDTKTSNHYLADLLGYLYCCWFFQELPGIVSKREWCIQELLKEFEQQVFIEGTDYESSTSYHQLVTEIFDHVGLLAEHMKIPLPDSFFIKLQRMHEFIEWCRINKHEMIRIGDDDSGKITFFQCKTTPLNAGITKKQTNIKHFSRFGLSIAKDNDWHISLRHHAYQSNQPSAHFHNDFLAVTLALNGIPILIDPGSYLYTASSEWRNHFRSASVHNTLYVKNHEPIPFDDRLFALNIPQALGSNSFCTSHNLYARFGLTLQRNIAWNNQSVMITDSWNHLKQELTLAWNFTLHPAIRAVHENDRWILVHENKPLVALQSTVSFTQESTWISPEYGIKQESFCLNAHYSGSGNESTIVFIKL